MNNKKIYIEAGANDGIFQSRSLHLQNNEAYHGILIEPIPLLYSHCIRHRSNTSVYNCALVDFDYTESDIPINIHNSFLAMCSILPHTSEVYSTTIKVPARTLDSILEENSISKIDSFYLDVEGYELNVLNGINFNKRLFKMIEVECHYNFLNIPEETEQSNIINLLQKYDYKLIDKNCQEGNTKLVFHHD
jgi:FkbM family methyltransferase